jgi:hypothetical protein
VSGFRSAGSLTVRVAMPGLVALAATVASATAQETVSIAVPPAVGFSVTDVSASTPGSPSPATISFSNASLNSGKSLRISVQADASAFTPPSGSSIPASKVSWTTLGAAGGVGMNGTLSATSYTLVFQSNPSPSSGHADLEWTLAAPGGGVRAGLHQLTVRWKLESIMP